ncbi:Zinc/iron permease, partial [Rhodotorula diobovata]
ACGSGSPYDGNLGLRVGAIFIILVTSGCGTLFPVIARRTRLRISDLVYSAFKYFGSGVIIATAFIHLLAPAFDALGSECLTGAWTEYDWAPAIAMASVFGIFLLELVATRMGRSFLQKRGLKEHDPHRARGNDVVGHTGHGTHAPGIEAVKSRDATVRGEEADLEAGAEAKPHAHGHGHAHAHDEEDDDELQESAVAQCIGVAILETGVLFHSFVIGLTLAVSENLGPLLAVLTFHQTFEGVGLGSRLSVLPLPRKYNWVPIVAALVYACTTPLGIAVGLGIRTTYNPDSAAASIVSGVLDATSAGILLWAGLVECLAHDFVFSSTMAEASNGEVTFAVFFLLIGAGLMALLGRWA